MISRPPRRKKNGSAPIIEFRPLQVTAMPDIPLHAVFSFLKETRCDLTWMTKEMADSLKISHREAGQVISILELQGYVKAVSDKGEWMTTLDGETVSGSKPLHFSLERVNKALVDLETRIAAINKDRSAAFHIAEAVAFGDFLQGKPLVQAADIGIRLVAHKQDANEDEFLKRLRARNAALQLQSYQPWMGKRLHRRLIH